MKKYLDLLRIKHYIKNILVFIPLFFAGQVFEIKYSSKLLYAFFAFSFVSSAIYIINDLCDIEKDKLHIVKRNRPIPSGKVSVRKAKIIVIFLLLFSILMNFFAMRLFNLEASTYLVLYFIINIIYSKGAKNIPIIDVIILSSGFLLRIMYGASISSVIVSNFLYLTVIAFTLYMGLGKRRNEISIQKDGNTRKVLASYNYNFLDKNMYMCLTLGLVFYSMWILNLNGNIVANDNKLLWSVPLVILICMKYNLIIEGQSIGDPVDVLISDKLLIFLVIVYAIFTFICIYGL